LKILARLLLIAFVRFLYTCAFFCSFKCYSAIGAFFGLLSFCFSPGLKKVALKNLSKAFPEYSQEKINQIARQCFINQGRNLFELFKFGSLDESQISSLISFPDRKNLDEALKRGKGVLYVTAHFGNWELMGAGLSLMGYPINVIARRIYLEHLNNLLVKLRNKVGMKVILRSDESSARDILKALKNNEVIGVLIDQDTDVKGVFVDFFGRKAFTTSGLAAIALRSSASVVSGFLIRQEKGHVLKVSPPLELTVTGDKTVDIQNNTQRFTKIVEDIVRQYPEQWVWMHKRWKTKEDE
jgi:Kdo2-lipid IVA lauroyltransferase/acyltransferase